MGKVDKERAEKVATSCFATCTHATGSKDRLERPLPSHELAVLIERGKQEFDEIYIEPEANPPIVLDGKADDVFEAIIKKRYRAIPFWDPGLVAAWRNYVLSDGPMPRKPGRRRAHNVRVGQPTLNDHAD
jgi:hypothetical protein